MIETHNLFIRRFNDTDSNDLYEYLSNPEIYAYEPGQPISLSEAERIAKDRSEGIDFYAVVLKENQKMIGHLYFKQIDPHVMMTWELGYIFNPSYQRKGYASEAARALIEYAFPKYKVHRIMAKCDPKNPASWKLLEKIGFQREGHFIQHATFRNDEAGKPIWHDAYEYGLLKEDLEKRG
jgi:RimJ/RimL family protein N-acetyltransferase